MALAAMADAVSMWIADRLLAGSIQGAIVITLVWAMCRSLRLSPAIQAGLWWFASLKLVLVMVPVPAMPIAILPAEPPPEETLPASARAGPYVERDPPTQQPSLNPWRTSAVALWAAIFAMQGFRLASAVRRQRGVVNRSLPASDADMAAVAWLSSALGLGRAPAVRASDEITAPLVCGVRTPVVLLPEAERASLTDHERAMAIAHELTHIRRHDLALGLVPLAAERLFFFHPLARLAAREYLTAREMACDAAVVRALGVEPADYGRLLVRLGIAHLHPALAATSASPSKSSLTRRLNMLQQTTTSGRSRTTTWCVAALVVLALIPVRLVARPQASLPATPVTPATPLTPQPLAPMAAPALPAEPDALALPDFQEVERLVEQVQLQADEQEAMRNALMAQQPQIEQQVQAAQELASRQTLEILEMMRELGERNAAQARAVVRAPQRAPRPEDAPRPEELEQLLARNFEELARQQERLQRNQQLMAEHQERLAEAQRRLTDETVRLREAIDRAITALGRQN
jgi:beta-lactamase regulating signal transducer with metallopeptidase domain